MAATSRGAPRFLPTLTEVVHARPTEPEQAPPAPVVPPAPDLVADRVHRQVEAWVDARLPEVVSAVLQGQVETIVARLRNDLEPMLRQVVEEVVRHELGQRQRR